MNDNVSHWLAPNCSRLRRGALKTESVYMGMSRGVRILWRVPIHRYQHARMGPIRSQRFERRRP